MDHIEKIAVQQTIGQIMDSAEMLPAHGRRLFKLQQSPCLGRFDFRLESRGRAGA